MVELRFPNPDIEAMRKEWQRQEDNPLKEPCPRCGGLHNHALNIDKILRDAVESLKQDIMKNVADKIEREILGNK